MARKKRVDLSIDDKFKVLEALKTPGGTIMKVADQFNIFRRVQQSKELLGQLQHSPSILGKRRKRDQEQNDVGGALA